MACPLGLSFDLDGTLAPLGRLKPRLWRAFLEEPAILGSYEEAVRSCRGVRHPDLGLAVRDWIVERTKKSPEEVARVLRTVFDDLWPQLYRHATVPAGVQAILDRAEAKGIPMVVVSDHPALGKLDAMGLTGRFAGVVDCTRLGAYKPFPDGLHAAAAVLGIALPDLVHIGDRWDTDGLMAARAGARFVLAEPGPLAQLLAEIETPSTIGLSR